MGLNPERFRGRALYDILALTRQQGLGLEKCAEPRSRVYSADDLAIMLTTFGRC